MSSLDVVFVYAFDETQSTSLYHARVGQVLAMVQKKLAQFPGSCISSVYPNLAYNRYSTQTIEVAGDGSIKNYKRSYTTKGCDENMASGLPEAHRLITSLSSKKPRGIIFLFSDGSSTSMKGRFFDKAEDFVSKFPVHTFTLGSDAYNPGLCNIAANSPGGTFNSIPIPDKLDQSSPLSLLLDGILSGSMKDDEKPPTSNSGTGSNKGLVSIKEVKYLKDAALTADPAVTAEVEIRATSSAAMREGLDLVAVLDVSCRKDTSKIQNLKKAMEFVIKKLTPVDRLSIVTFCDGAARLTPLRCMTPAAQKELIAIVDGLSVPARSSRGGTNIKAGLDTGLAVIADRVNTTARTANVFLVSDGKQTVGDARVVDPGEVAVYTFGVGGGGGDSDHQLLSDLATKSRGGMFSAVSDGANDLIVALSQSQLLGGLQLHTVVAQDVQLTLTPKTDVVDTASAVARGSDADDYDTHSIDDDGNGAITINLGTLFAGVGRKVVITLGVKDSAATQEYDGALVEAHHVRLHPEPECY